MIKDKRYFEGCELLEVYKNDEAEVLFRDLLSEQPEHYEAINKLGVVFARKGLKADAKKCFDNALMLVSDYAPSWVNLGNLLLEENDFDSAWKMYEKAKECDDEYPYTYYGMAIVHKKRGEIKQYISLLKTFRRMQRRKLPEEQDQLRLQYKRKLGCLPGVAAFLLAIGTSAFTLINTLS